MKILSLVLTLILTLSLCGCYDSKEIDETAYIIALGIDKTANSAYNYTFQFSAPLATMSSEGSKGGAEGDLKENPTVRNIVISAPDFYTAKNLTNNFLSKTVDMSHLKLMVFSASVDQDGFLEHSQFMLREREVRPHTAIALAKTTAEEYLKSINPELEANTAKYYELMSLRSNNVYSPTKRLSDFVDEISAEGGISCLPVATSGDSSYSLNNQNKTSNWVSLDDTKVKSQKAEMRGMAIFKNGQPTAALDGDLAMVYNILRRDIKSCVITLKNPHLDDSFISFRLNIPHACEYSLDNTKKPCRIKINQGFDIEFLGGHLPSGFSSYDELFSFADSSITQKVTAYFYQLSRNYHADIMKIGDSFKKSFWATENFLASNWEDIFASAEFDIDIYFI